MPVQSEFRGKAMPGGIGPIGRKAMPDKPATTSISGAQPAQIIRLIP